jgi:hypothetical protein
MDQKARQQPTPLCTAQIDGPRLPDDFEWAKDPEFHRHPLPRPLAPGKPPRRS